MKRVIFILFVLLAVVSCSSSSKNEQSKILRFAHPFPESHLFLMFIKTWLT